MNKKLSEKIYEAVASEINSGVTDYQDICENVADKLSMEKSMGNLNLIQGGIREFNDIHDTEY